MDVAKVGEVSRACGRFLIAIVIQLYEPFAERLGLEVQAGHFSLLSCDASGVTNVNQKVINATVKKLRPS